MFETCTCCNAVHTTYTLEALGFPEIQLSCSCVLRETPVFYVTNRAQCTSGRCRLLTIPQMLSMAAAERLLDASWPRGADKELANPSAGFYLRRIEKSPLGTKYSMGVARYLMTKPSRTARVLDDAQRWALYIQKAMLMQLFCACNLKILPYQPQDGDFGIAVPEVIE